jgi:hypothetical protein
MRSALRLFQLLVILPASLTVLIAWTATEESVEQLRLDYAALQAAEEDYRTQREFNGLSGTEAADYAAYVARLQRRVFEDCQAVMRSGSPFPEDLPCPVIVPPVTQSADIATHSELTLQEQVAALDEKLVTGLGEYDEKLLREQERIKAATPNYNSDSGDGGGAGAGESGDGSMGDGQEGDGEGAGGAGQGESRDSGESADSDGAGANAGGRMAGGPADSSSGSGDTGSDQDQPADIPDGSDDDVVARQLREAAEKETDPELKAKLWEEYRRYKQGTR